MSEAMQPTHNSNLEAIRQAISTRLRGSCANLSDEEFGKLVTRMALLEWKHLNDATPTSQMLARRAG